MYLIAIGWLYVALMMSAAELTHPAGGVLGALITFVVYGLAPVALLMYLLGGRWRRKARERAEESTIGTTPMGDAAPTSGVTQADGSSHAAADAAVAPKREVL